MVIPQTKFGFFLAFKQSVWPLSSLFLYYLTFCWNFHLAPWARCAGGPTYGIFLMRDFRQFLFS